MIYKIIKILVLTIVFSNCKNDNECKRHYMSEFKINEDKFNKISKYIFDKYCNYQSKSNSIYFVSTQNKINESNKINDEIISNFIRNNNIIIIRMDKKDYCESVANYNLVIFELDDLGTNSNCSFIYHKCKINTPDVINSNISSYRLTDNFELLIEN